MRGSDVASLLNSAQWFGGDSVIDRWMDDGRMEGQAHENNVGLAHPYDEGKWYSKVALTQPSGLGGDNLRNS